MLGIGGSIVRSSRSDGRGSPRKITPDRITPAPASGSRPRTYTAPVPFGFGRKPLEEQLAESGQRATAVVMSSEPTKPSESAYGNELCGRKWILQLRVQPPDAEAFDVEIKSSLKALCMPRVGDTFDVLYDPADTRRTVIDPALGLATKPYTHSQYRAEVTLPYGREAIADAQNAPPQHREELERFALFYSKGCLSDDEFQELRQRILSGP
jgi:hypothetical protein